MPNKFTVDLNALHEVATKSLPGASQDLWHAYGDAWNASSAADQAFCGGLYADLGTRWDALISGLTDALERSATNLELAGIVLEKIVQRYRAVDVDAARRAAGAAP